MRSIPREIIQDPNRIVGHRRNRPEERPAIALPNAEVVVVTATVVVLELVYLRPPNRTRHPEPHDEENRRPLLTEHLIRQARPCPRKVLIH
jgi:hypothetical protein